MMMIWQSELDVWTRCLMERAMGHIMAMATSATVIVNLELLIEKQRGHAFAPTRVRRDDATPIPSQSRPVPWSRDIRSKTDSTQTNMRLVSFRQPHRVTVQYSGTVYTKATERSPCLLYARPDLTTYSSRLQRIHDNATATRKGRPVHPRTSKTYQWTSPLDVIAAPLRTRSSRRERNVEHIGGCKILARARSSCWRRRRPPRGTSPTASSIITAAPSGPIILSLLFLSRFDISGPIIPTSLSIDGGGGCGRGTSARLPSR